MLDGMLDGWFGELRHLLADLAAARRLTPRASDAVAGYGELLSSAILSYALTHAGINAEWVDCRQVIVTDEEFTRARPVYALTDPRLRDRLMPLLREGKVPVLGGYVGATASGVPTTLGKEGSDFSAAIVGAALGAKEIHIWTDVNGILTADPRIFARARQVRTLSFGEALELACSGTKKPHYGTIEPARRANVPIRILNSKHVEAAGTIIGRRDPQAPPSVKSIACRINELFLTLRPKAGAGGPFRDAVTRICTQFRPELLVVSCADTGAVLALAHQERRDEIVAAVTEHAEHELAPGHATVSLVSDDLATSAELRERVLSAARALAPELVCVGSAAPAVRMAVADGLLPSVVAELHGRLFSGGPEEVVP
jgi:aspartate kinase